MLRRIVLEKPLICIIMLENGSRLIGYFMLFHKLYQNLIIAISVIHHSRVVSSLEKNFRCLG